MNIWSIEITGRNLRQLTNGEMNALADCSADGNTMIYSSKSTQGFNIVKAPMREGTPQNLLSASFAIGRYSPDGKEIGVFAFGGKLSMKNARLLMINSADGDIEKTFPLPPGDTP